MNTSNIGTMCKLIVTLCLLITSCEKENNMQTSLFGSWQIEYLIDKTNNEQVEYPDTLEKKETIILTDSSYVLFEGNCNYGGASFTINQNEISISNIHISELPCQSGWEYIFYELLHAKYYKLKNSRLEIETNGNYDLVFEKE